MPDPILDAKKTLISVLLVACLTALACAPAHAAPIDDAKSAGEIGEQYDGYLGIVEPPGSAAVRALVADINERRRAQYRAIAQRNDADLGAVELLAGQKAIERTAPGLFIRLPGEAWRRK